MRPMQRMPLLAVACLCWYLVLASLMHNSLVATTHLSARPTYEDVAVAVLATSDAFYSGAIGYGGMPSAQALAWNTLLQLPRADSLFQHLFEVGNRAGQLYALAGLF